jgi:uncharacterized protein
MRILPKTIEFQWDRGNVRKNIIKHKVTNQEAEEIFTQRHFLTTKDARHSTISEQRYHGLGQTKNGRKLQVTFTLRGKKVRIISIRDMDRKERKKYEET